MSSPHLEICPVAFTNVRVVYMHVQKLIKCFVVDFLFFLFFFPFTDAALRLITVGVHVNHSLI